MMAAFFAMGGYARFVWPAYAVAALVLLGLLLWSLAGYRRIKIQLAAREAKSPRQRKRTPRNP